MTDYTKYIPYAIRAVTHKVKGIGWTPQGATHRNSIKFLDVSSEPSLKNRIVDPKKSRAVHLDMAKAMSLRTGDLVQVLYGRDAGNTGVIRRIQRVTNQVIVTGCNIVRSYIPSEGERQVNPSLPLHVAVEAPIHVTNVVPLDPVVKRPTRIKSRVSMTGEPVRISKISGCAMPENTIERASRMLSDRAMGWKLREKSNVRRGAPLAEQTLSSWTNDQREFKKLSNLIK